MQDLAVSLYIPGADMKPSQHGGAVTTSYATPNGSGDAAATEDAKAFTVKTQAMYWLKSIDVQSASSTGAIVAFGDSITDGTCSTLDAHDRWEDVLETRIVMEAYGQKNKDAHKAMVNEGIGGNTVTTKNTEPVAENPGIERLDRDVLSHHGVTHVILFMGTNDLRRGAPAQQVMDGMSDIIKRVKAAGMKIYGVTIIPRHNRAAEPNNSGWNPDRTRMRNEINQWIRTKAPFDGVIDFDKVVQDSKNPDLIAPAFNCGDGIHPTPRGYFEMGNSVRLDLLK
jgi:lysophospholipase L1-like esterase